MGQSSVFIELCKLWVYFHAKGIMAYNPFVMNESYAGAATFSPGPRKETHWLAGWMTFTQEQKEKGAFFIPINYS